MMWFEQSSAKFVIGEESPPPPSPLRKRNAPTKNQRGSYSSVHKKIKMNCIFGNVVLEM
jgi:hypothetical protein